MKLNLGKILALLFLSINIYAASVKVDVSSLAIYKGDLLQFTITASGNNIKFPSIKQIDNYAVLGVSNSEQTSIINGKVSHKLIKTYTIKPLKDITIPSFKVNINGDEYKTKEIKVSVVKTHQSKNTDNFVLRMKVDNENLKVGQSTKLRVIYKQKIGVQADKLNINEPKIKDFWIKKIDGVKQYSQGEYLVQELSYMIFAQKEGEFDVDAIEFDIGHIVRSPGGGFMNDPFFSAFTNQLTWDKIYSNSLHLKVQSLPNNIELYGDFDIKATVDKTQVYENKPVNLTISIKGIGNIDDIKKFDINIQDAVVYANKPEVQSKLINGQYKGSFTQQIAIIASEDFTIPSIQLKFFNKNTQQIQTIKTKQINIKVKGQNKSSVNNTPKVQKLNKTISNNSNKIEKQKVIVVKKSDNLEYLFLLIGLVLGSVITYFVLKQKNNIKQKEENDIIKLIKNTKDDKKLFDILLPYANDYDEVSNILKQLEENIYKKTNHKINKQKLYDIFL